MRISCFTFKHQNPSKLLTSSLYKLSNIKSRISTLYFFKKDINPTSTSRNRRKNDNKSSFCASTPKLHRVTFGLLSNLLTCTKENEHYSRLSSSSSSSRLKASARSVLFSFLSNLANPMLPSEAPFVRDCASSSSSPASPE